MFGVFPAPIPGNFQRIDLPDSDIIFYPVLFSRQESDEFFKDLSERIDWKQERIKLYGRTMDMPRLTTWYGDEGAAYRYSGIVVKPHSWTPDLLKIKSSVEKAGGVNFNSVLLNQYRTKRDSVAWHSDDEPELGEEPVIGSVSFGETRRFQLKHKQNTSLRHEIDLTHGSFLLMKGMTQHRWLHQIPKETRYCGPRINLTFRVIRRRVLRSAWIAF